MGTLNDYFIPVGCDIGKSRFKPVTSFRSKINLIGKKKNSDPPQKQSTGTLVDYIKDVLEKESNKNYEDAYERAKKATETM